MLTNVLAATSKSSGPVSAGLVEVVMVIIIAVIIAAIIMAVRKGLKSLPTAKVGREPKSKFGKWLIG